MNIYRNKQILITGGTGSFGNEFCRKIINNKIKPRRLIIFSRDEFKQAEMEKKYPVNKFPFIRFFIGDIRDKERLYRAMENIDIVIHAAALKHVNLGEYNPMEVIKTNVIGSQNIVDACLDMNVKNVIALSTDKASSPVNLYGATKLCSDKIFLSANNIKGSRKIKFSVVRYGNVLGSRGSVVPLFLSLNKNKKKFTLTHKEMTRFNITLEEGVKFVDSCLKNNYGGEIFVPKLKSFKVTDLAKAINKNAEFINIGLRPGEKIHEELISESDIPNTLEGKNHFVILNYHSKINIQNYKKKNKLSELKTETKYSSDLNKSFLSINDLRQLLRVHKFI
jgi:UDP-N-acetylglucosamine 4,6-dehydratase (inverting)